MTKRVLGRGLEALIPSGAPPTPTEGGVATAPDPSVRELPIAAIRPNPRQPRHHIDEKALQELEASIRAQGILQPLLVRPANEGYELIAGERRFLAAQRAGLEQVPVVVREFGDQQILEASLVENLQREDLDPIDEAMGFQALMDDLGYTHERVAERVGKDRTTITNSLRLLSLPQEVQDLVSRGTLSAGHARALLSLSSHDDILAAARYVTSMGFSVRKTEAFVSRKLKRRIQARRRSAAGAARAGLALGSALADIEERLRRQFATQVRIVPQGNGGKIEIEYYSQPELERLLEVWGAL
jgi:ParB family transcriptional regulator, chromosome partitioning protein